MEKVQYKKSDFYYDLPEERIAQTPAEPRDSSRLLVYDRAQKTITDRVFRDVIDYLHEGDVLVVNNTKVIPARMYARTVHGGVVEVLLLKRYDLNTWEVLMRPGKKGKIGVKMTVSDELSFEVKDVTETGERVIEFSYEGAFEDVLSKVGTMPLPPYIREKLENQARYNTVYSKVDGSAAAPTAGLHFTVELLAKLKEKGVEMAEVPSSQSLDQSLTILLVDTSQCLVDIILLCHYQVSCRLYGNSCFLKNRKSRERCTNSPRYDS